MPDLTGINAPRSINEEPPITIGFDTDGVRAKPYYRVFGVRLNDARAEDLLSAYREAEAWTEEHAERWPAGTSVQLTGRREIEIEIRRRAEGLSAYRSDRPANDDYPVVSRSDLSSASTSALWRGLGSINDELVKRGSA